MKHAHPALVGVMTALLVTISTVCFLPGIFMALLLGYGWTYAFGAVDGICFGTLTFYVGTQFGAISRKPSYLGQIPCCATCVGKLRTPSCIVPLLDHYFKEKPLKFLIVLRLTPLVPFNLLNYYAGAAVNAEGPRTLASGASSSGT